MNIKKWKENPAIQETRIKVEEKLEDRKVRRTLNWIFQILVALVFGILVGISLFQSVTMQENSYGAYFAGRRAFFCESGII